MERHYTRDCENRMWREDTRELGRNQVKESRQNHWEVRRGEFTREKNEQYSNREPQSRKAETFEAATLFISGLPEDMDVTWLKNIFSGAGKVIEVKIPWKRSFHLNQKFGFVKYENKIEGLKAIKMWNTAQIQGHHLVVKFARFGNSRWMQGREKKNGRNAEVKKIYRVVKRNSISGNQSIDNEGQNGNSRHYAKKNPSIPASGFNKEEKEKEIHSIKVSKMGNSWLYRSAIAKLSPSRSMIYMQDHLRNLGHPDVTVRPIDSNQVVLTFPTIDERDSIFNGGKMSWLKGYFLEIQRWNDTIDSQRTRLVWLNCYGIPLHVWNGPTFNKIGHIWGDVILISEESFNCMSFIVGKVLISTSHMETINQVISLVNKDKKFNIRVSEEQYVINTYVRSNCCKGCSCSEFQNGHDKLIEKEDVAVLGSWTEMRLDKEDGEAVEGAAQVMKSTAIKGKELVATSKDVSNEASSSGTEISMEGIGRDPQGGNECDAQESLVANSVADNFIIPNHFSEVNQEIDNSKQLNAENQANAAEEDQLVGPIKATVSNVKGKKKRKTIEDILGLTKIKTQSSKGRKGKQKCVVFRSTISAAALSASISSDGIANRNIIILDEAQAIWECNKLIGLGYDGEEEEVISKIAEMVSQDNEKAGRVVRLF